MRCLAGFVLVASTLVSCAPAEPPEVAPTTKPQGSTKPDEAVPAADRSQIPGSRVSFVLPDGYERVAHSPAFVNPETATAVAVIDLNGGQEAADGAISSMLEKLGPDAERTDFVRDGVPGVLLANKRYRGLVLVSGEAVGGVVVKFSGSLEQEADSIVESVRVDPKVPLDPLSTLGISVDDVPGLQPVKRSAPIALFAESGSEPPLAPDVASLAVVFVPIPGPVPDEQLGQLIGNLIRHHEPDIDAATMSDVVIDKIPGVEVVTQGTHEGVAVTVYAVGLSSKDGVFILFGTVGKRRERDMIPKLRQLATSLRRT